MRKSTTIIQTNLFTINKVEHGTYTWYAVHAYRYGRERGETDWTSRETRAAAVAYCRALKRWWDELECLRYDEMRECIMKEVCG